MENQTENATVEYNTEENEDVAEIESAGMKALRTITVVGVFVASMILLFSMLLGCATNFYTKTDTLALLVLEETNIRNQKDGKFIRFVIANPTSERKHVVLRCVAPYSDELVIEQDIVVNPRSDKYVGLRLLNTATCGLIPSPFAGSENYTR